MAVIRVKDVDRLALKAHVEAVQAWQKARQQGVGTTLADFLAFQELTASVARTARDLVLVWTSDPTSDGPTPWENGPKLVVAVERTAVGEEVLREGVGKLHALGDAAAQSGRGLNDPHLVQEATALLTDLMPVVDAGSRLVAEIERLSSAEFIDRVTDDVRRRGLNVDTTEALGRDGGYIRSTTISFDSPREPQKKWWWWRRKRGRATDTESTSLWPLA